MANTKIPSELIADSSITAAKLADGTITTADIADSNVTTAKIADSNVTTAKIGDAQVTTAKITDANVTTVKIAEDAVTTAKMASNSVTSDTIASGITLAGTTTLSSHLVIGDNNIIKVGDAADLQIYHDANNSYIKDQGTGQLVIDGNAVILQYSSGSKLATTSTGITVTGNIANASGDLTLDVGGDIILDADGDNIFYKAGGSSFYSISNVSGNTYLGIEQADKDLFIRGNDSNNGGVFTALSFDMSDRGKATFYSGITAGASTAGDWGLTLNTEAGDNMKLRVQDTGSSGGAHGTLSVSDGSLIFDVAGGITLDADGGQVDFKDAGTLKALIDFTGSNVEIQSRVTDADILFRGQDGSSFITALTLDMSNSGQATFNSSVFVGNHLYLVDNKKAVFGDGEDLQIFSDGTHGFIRNHTDGGSVYNRAHTNWVVQTNASDGGADTAIQALRNGAIELYHDNDLTFQTTTSGVQIGRNNDTTVRLQLYGAGSADHEIFFGNDGTNGHKDGAIRYYGETNGVTANRRAMTFSTANSEKMRITSAGVLESKSHVITGIDNNAFEVKTNHSGNPSAVKVAGTGSINGISGSFQNFTVLNVMQDSGALNSIYAAGNIKTDGNINIGTSGKGISFSPTGDGSGSMSSELLDDYEEGSWTPACGATLSTAEGKYTKIGNQVTVYYHLVTTGGLPTSTSQVVITGLPYTSNSGSLVAAPIYARYYTPNDSSLTSLVYDNESQIRLMNINDQNFDLTIWGELEASHNNSVYMIGSATYMV